MKALRHVTRPLGLALFVLFLTPFAAVAIDCTTNMCGFSSGQITGLRDTFVDALNTETIAGDKTLTGTTVISGTTTLSGSTTASGAFNMTSTIQIGGTTVSATAAELDDATVQIIVQDISSGATDIAVSAFAGTVTDWYCVLEGALTGEGAVLQLGVDGQDVTTNGSLTVEHVGSAEGDVNSAGSLAGNVTVSVGSYITVHTDGGSTGTFTESCTIVIDR